MEFGEGFVGGLRSQLRLFFHYRTPTVAFLFQTKPAPSDMPLSRGGVDLPTKIKGKVLSLLVAYLLSWEISPSPLFGERPDRNTDL